MEELNIMPLLTKIYAISVTEEEVHAGVLDNTSPNCLAFSRSLISVDNYDDPMSAKFFDVVFRDERKTIDKDKKERLEKLKSATDEKVSFDKCYEAEWMRNGLAPTQSKKNDDYLNNFCHDFKEKMKTKILASIHETTGKKTQQALYDEITHHAKFSVTRKDRFLGQLTVIEKVKSYLQDREKCMKPLILHGPSGCGKTSVMSVLVDKVKDWLGGGTVTMIRFLGTSPNSSDMKSTLLSFIKQLRQVFNISLPKEKDIDSQNKLILFFWKLLSFISSDCFTKDSANPQETESKSKLVLFIDSLDQVNYNEVAGLFQWLPSELPPDVYIITSIASNVNTTQFNNMRKRFLNDDQYIEMKALGEEDMALILTNNLARQHRKVDQGQMEVLVDAARQCGWPLYLTLLANEASKWKSFDVIDKLSIQTTVHAAINKIFHDLEVKYNALFVRTCLGYLTVSEGISEVELEDLISLNDDVLDSVYEFHNPPLEGVIRVPPLLWARVRVELEEFLVERDVDGATVLSWYHRQFWETAEQRYLRPPTQHTTDKTEDLSLYHKYNQHLSDLFMVETPVKRTIHLTRRNYCIEDADRLVTLQPLTAANRRKLIKLPQFLMRSGTLDSMVKLNELILCNPKWLMTKMQGVSYQAVLDDFTVTDLQDPEIRFVHSLLKLAAPVLEKDPILLPLEIISRLPRDTKYLPTIQTLISHSFSIFEEEKGMKLFPLFPCLPVPDGHLVATYKGPTHLVTMIPNSSAIIWGDDCGLQVWNINTHRVIHQLGEPLSLNDIQCPADGREVYHTEGTMLVGWSTESGNMILDLEILSEYIESESDLLTTMGVSLDGNYVAVRINHKELLLDGCGLVIVDVKLGKVVCTTGEGCCGHTIQAVRFLDANNVFYSMKKTLVKFDVQTQDTQKVTIDQNVRVKANAENSVMTSTALHTDRQELVISCGRENIIVVSIDSWKLRYPKLEPQSEEDKKKLRYGRYGPTYNLIAYARLSTNESLILGFNGGSRRTVLKVLDTDYNYVAETSKQVERMTPDKPFIFSVCSEYRLAFVSYTTLSVIDIWDMHPGAQCIIHTLYVRTKVTNIHLDPSTRLLYTSSMDETITIWDTRQFLGSFYEQHSERERGEVCEAMEGVSKPEHTQTETETTTRNHDSEAETTENHEEHLENNDKMYETTTELISNVVSDTTDIPQNKTVDSLSLHSHTVKDTHMTTERAVLSGLESVHKVAKGVTDLIFTRDGRQMYTCYDNKLPLEWDPTTGKSLNYVTSTETFGNTMADIM